ncbi:hypothetical protein Q5P01_021263 [Channa striata]|uniref:Uncharacterized protein n=1 Tax=Channa striata TaxID=64152 RepID=A0AA88LU62_CHASR|nr:hypothetical protein Q5P01_021263 [Channa striata]
MAAGAFGGMAQHWGFQSQKRSSSNTPLLKVLNSISQSAQRQDSSSPHWPSSPSSGGRHEAVVRSWRRAAELKRGAHAERLTPCSAVRLRKRLRAAKAERCSG